MRLSVALTVSPMAGGYGGRDDWQTASQHDRAKRFYVLVDDEYEEGDARQHRPSVIVDQDQQVGLAANLGVLPQFYSHLSGRAGICTSGIPPVVHALGGSLRVIQAGSTDGSSVSSLLVDGARRSAL